MPDANANTAEAQLGRILYILAAAHGEEGVPVAELAARLDVPPATIRDDVAEVTAREYYHCGGWVMEMTILLERGRISVPVGNYLRPMRFTPQEAAALGLALRARAVEAEAARRAELLDLAKDLEKALMAPVPKTHGQGDGGGTGSARATRATLARWAEIDPGDSARAGVRLLLQQAVAEHTPVQIRYLKPGDGAPEDRLIHPYALLSAEGEWYVLAFCLERRAMREFRLDRVLEAQRGHGSFNVPASFHVEDYTREGKPYRPSAVESEVAVLVRYSARVAPWILERYPDCAQRCADGSVVVRHQVANRRWLVREILHFAGDAVVEGPEEIRELVARAAAAVARSCA